MLDKKQGCEKEKSALLRRVMMVDFAIHEAALFLDTHPENKKALAYYHKMREMRQVLMAEFNEKHGPLTKGDVKGDTWSWIDTPWPWQN